MAAWAVVLLLAQLLEAARCSAPSVNGTVGDFLIRWDAQQQSISVEHPNVSHIIFATTPAPFVSASTTAWTIENDGNWGKQELNGGLDCYDGVPQFLSCPHGWCPAPTLASNQTVDTVTANATHFQVLGGFADVPGLGYALTFFAGSSSERDLGFALEVTDSQPRDQRFVQSSLQVHAEAQEAFWGFGEQFTVFNQRGKLLRLINMEQGIFRGLQPESAALNLNAPGTAGDWWTTYIAIPQYITSSGRALFFENYEPFVFDLTPEDRVVVSVNSSSMQGHILAGQNPSELLTYYTLHSGRMAALPEWIGDGAVVHVQGGSEQVTPMVDALKTANVSLAALWVEDWCGAYHDPATGSVQVAYNWVLDRSHYPDWDALVSNTSSMGARIMVYLNPFLIWTPTQAEGGNATRNLYDEAAYYGFLVQYNGTVGPNHTAYYGPYLSVLIAREGAMLDLSNPYAVQWFQQVIWNEVYSVAQASGYMADFGEWLPYRQGDRLGQDVVLFANKSAVSYHNQYTEDWAALHKPVAEAWSKNPGVANLDPVVMTRTGYSKTPGQAQLMWLGDQTVLWDDKDGLASALTGLLSGGLSGFSINHGDIGGYAGNGFSSLKFLKLCRTKNLLLRWTEMNVFSPVFRTHLGNAPNTNTQVFSDHDTISHFARFARLFAFMRPYREQLMQDAATLGWPLVRPLLLHHPEDQKTWDLNTQFLFGEHLLVAPVLHGKLEYKRTYPVIGPIEYVYAELSVYLPAGNWTRLWHEDSGVLVSAGQNFKLEVRFGEPAVFYHQGWDYGEQLSEFVNGELAQKFPSPNTTSAAHWNDCSNS